MKVKSKIFYTYVTLVIAFTLLTLLPAPNRTTLFRYHLTPTGLRGIDVTIIIAEAGIWFAAFYGYGKLFRYSRLIRSSKESHHIGRMARGLLLLALGLPITAVISSVLSIIAAHNPGFAVPTVIINNYISVVFPLLAMLWISIGARGLGSLAKTRPSLGMLNVVILISLILGVVFCSLLVLDHKQLRTVYHMSPELAMLTLGISYIYTWVLGLYAASELHAYTKRLAGVVYRKGWNLMILGVLGFILLSIVLQYLSTLSTWVTSLTLIELLVLLYVLLLLFIAVFIVFALGARQLIKIEEV